MLLFDLLCDGRLYTDTFGGSANIERVAGKLFLASGWEVPGITSAANFFSALPQVLTLPTKLRFEGTSIAPEVRALLASSAVTATLEIPPGTIWPAPAIFHVLATESFIHDLTAVAQRHPEHKLFDHFHAYNDTHLLMQWYDAFLLPLLIDQSVAEASVHKFCSTLGLQYARWHAGDRPSKRGK